MYNSSFNIETKWFQKHISSGRFLNYHTHHPKTVIWNTAVAYVVTMIKNTSPKYFEEIINKARHLLKINSYPSNYRDNVIKKAIDKASASNTSTQASQNTSKNADTSKATYVRGIPYIPNLSQHIQADIEQSAKEAGDDIKTASIPIHKMSQVVYNKHKKISNSQQLKSIDIQHNSDSD